MKTKIIGLPKPPPGEDDIEMPTGNGTMDEEEMGPQYHAFINICK